MKGSYRNWAAIASGGSFLWINEGLKVKKHVANKGTIFVVIVIPHFKQWEKGGGDTEVAECEWHLITYHYKNKISVRCHGETLPSCQTVRMADEITGDKVIHIMKYILTTEI